MRLLLSVWLMLGVACSSPSRLDAGSEALDSGSDASTVSSDAGQAVFDAGGALEYPLLGVYTVALDGGELELILDAGVRELSHVRRLGTSPWLVATRYGQDPDRNGLSMEDEIGSTALYAGTEIVVFSLAFRTPTVVAGSPDAGMAANPSWVGADELVYVAAHSGAPVSIERATLSLLGTPSVVKRTQVPVPSALAAPVDPHQVGPSGETGLLAFSATLKLAGKWMRPLWVMPASGATDMAAVRFVGCPICAAEGGCCGWANLDEVLGTNDARMNHAGSEVVWMHQHPAKSFVIGSRTAYPYRQVKRPLDGGAQIDLAPLFIEPTTTQAYAEWRGDDGLLAYWSIEVVNATDRHFLNVMKPDGSERTRVPLPAQLCPQHASFFDAEHLLFNAWHCAAPNCSCDVAYLRAGN